MGLLNRGGDKKKAPTKKADSVKKKKKKRSSGGGAGLANAKQWLILNVEKLVLGLIGLAICARSHPKMALERGAKRWFRLVANVMGNC